MTDAGVRLATAADAAEIARIQVVTWRTAYLAVLPRSVLDALSVDDMSDTWAADLTATDTSDHKVLIAYEGDTLVGFAAMGPALEDPDGDVAVAEGPPATVPASSRPAASSPDAEGPVAEIATIVVEPRWGRRGHGSRLMSATAETLLSSGFATMVTWVAEADEVTGRFLSESGWEADGEVRVLDADGTDLRQYRMHAALH